MHTFADSRDWGEPATVRLRLLGGFRAEHAVTVPSSAWQQRRSAKALVKLIACHPGHVLHREQIVEALWPDVDLTSGLNSFAKALHVARRALEPSLPSRGISSYLRLSDDVLSLVPDAVWIDADHFQQTAESALRQGDVTSLEEALALYTGELLPEDTYKGWTSLRRVALADLHLRVLMALADAFECHGQSDKAIDRLTQVLQADPAREDVHRKLMRLHAASGNRLLALRQFHLCCEALKREVDADPETTTVALYEEIRSERTTAELPEVQIRLSQVRASIPVGGTATTPFVGREPMLHLLTSALTEAEKGAGGAVFVHGPLGVGKSRLVTELAREAATRGNLVLRGESFGIESELPYAPFAHALERYAGSCTPVERVALAERYPALLSIISSLSPGEDSETMTALQGVDQGRLFSTICRVLGDLARRQTVLLILEDLHAASDDAVHLLHYLATLAEWRLLIVGTYRQGELPSHSRLREVLAAGERGGFCRDLTLPMLGRAECDKLVKALVEPAMPSSSLLNEVWVASSGNPFFAIESLSALHESDGGWVEYDQWQMLGNGEREIPQRVVKVVDAYLSCARPQTDRVLALAALAGSDVSFQELCLAVHEAIDPHLIEPEIFSIFDEAVQSSVLTERGSGYSFTYSLFRAALCRGLSQQRRALFHAAIAHAVERCRPGSLDLLAHHRGHRDRASEAHSPRVELERDAG